MKGSLTASLACASTLVCSSQELRTAVLESPGGALRVEVAVMGDTLDEQVRIRVNGNWVTALSVSGSATRVMGGTSGEPLRCRVASVEKRDRPSRLVIQSDCAAGRVERTLTVTGEPDVIQVFVRFRPEGGVPTHSVEDRYTFAPGRRETDTPLQGPLDFVWSQQIKQEPGDLIPRWGFKSPSVMFQQGRVFVALMPRLDSDIETPLALDLDVTSQAKPWFSYGSVPSEPHGHSYFRRQAGATTRSGSEVIEYSYDVMASSQPSALGYRQVVRRLWKTLGRPHLLQSVDLQRNVRQHRLALFDDWRQEAWVRYANDVYREVDCPGGTCATLASKRNYMGQWDRGVDDAWFNSWFQTLRTAYGWYTYGLRTRNTEIQRKAEGILNLALSSPRQGGAFSTIYLVPEKRWIREDGWAGFPEHYHAFCMSWTAYWMLRWAQDLVPARKSDVLAFTREYGDFLVKQQLASGVIPSWYDATLTPRAEFRDYNAETAGSALFLLALGDATGNGAYVQAATRAMEFITRETLPRHRWFDFETFKSCARKPFDFYDGVTAQYPQNNLSTIQAAMAYLKLYQMSRRREWLDLGTRVVDYLLLTQQVWKVPGLDPPVLGGFTTQNTDAEWSDARQSYVTVLLLDYYQETHDPDYLERAVAAARASFAVAPWENWAHTGHQNEPGAMTGFHWGTGSAMTSVEIMAPLLGDAFVDIARQHGVGFNASSVRRVRVEDTLIALEVEAMPELETLNIRFVGARPDVRYTLVINESEPIAVSGTVLNRDGYALALRSGAPARRGR